MRGSVTSSSSSEVAAIVHCESDRTVLVSRSWWPRCGHATAEHGNGWARPMSNGFPRATRTCDGEGYVPIDVSTTVWGDGLAPRYTAVWEQIDEADMEVRLIIGRFGEHEPEAVRGTCRGDIQLPDRQCRS